MRPHGMTLWYLSHPSRPSAFTMRSQVERIGIAAGSLAGVGGGPLTTEESVMRKLLVAGVALSAFAAVTLGSQPVMADDCVVVRATADARNQTVSTERSKRRLQDYIGRKLNRFTAKSISTVTTHCIRNACESSAIVCRH
jgi:hypothetical protein